MITAELRDKVGITILKYGPITVPTIADVTGFDVDDVVEAVAGLRLDGLIEPAPLRKGGALQYRVVDL